MTPTSQLRARSILQIIDAAFRLYRSNFGRFFRITSFVIIPLVVLQVGYSVWLQLSHVATLEQFIALELLTEIEQFIINILLDASLIYVANQALLLHSSNNSNTYRRIIYRYCSILLLNLIFAYIDRIPIIPWFLHFFLYLAVVCSAIEGRGPISAIMRNWSLIRRQFWKVISVYVLISALLYLLQSLPLIFLIVINWQLDIDRFLSVTNIVTLLIQIPTYPIAVCTQVLLYYDLRIRSEGADLEQRIAQLNLNL